VAENGKGDRTIEMTGWNEDNFLERLLAQVQPQRGGDRDPCPDAETICAVLEGEAPAPLRELVLEHLRHCPECTGLQSRLLNFEAGSSPEPEAVWNETRKKLDNWLEGFLRSEAATSHAAKPTAASHKGPRWEAFWSSLHSRKVLWGAGVAALLVLIGDAVIVFEVRREQPPQAQVAARPAVPQKQPPVGAPVVGARPNTQQPAVAASRVGAQANQEHALPQVAQRSPAGAPPMGRQPFPHVAPSIPSHLPPPYPRDAGAPSGQAAAPSPPRPEISNPPSQTSQAATKLLPPSAGEVAQLAAQPSLRLELSAHLLTVLSSVTWLADGSFRFQATLLLPVPHAGAVPLDRGAEVIGLGRISQGRTSLTVTELVVQGVRYTLKGGDGAMRAQTPGAGGAVQFDRSQVLEMWPASSSTYEKAPDTAAQPEPQK